MPPPEAKVENGDQDVDDISRTCPTLQYDVSWDSRHQWETREGETLKTRLLMGEWITMVGDMLGDLRPVSIPARQESGFIRCGDRRFVASGIINIIPRFEREMLD